MARIFEALQQVEKEKSRHGSVIDFPQSIEPKPDAQVRDKMQELYRNILLQMPGSEGRVIQFLGPRGGVGASRSLRAFARVCTESLGQSVLIVDTETGSPQFRHFSLKARTTWAQAIAQQRPPEHAYCRVPHSRMTLIKAFDDSLSTAMLLHSKVFREQLTALKDDFDLILIDSPAADKSLDVYDLAAVVDASILVVAAEKTRWQVAQSVKESLEAAGGRVLGVLLNGLPFHIPESIYGRL